MMIGTTVCAPRLRHPYSTSGAARSRAWLSAALSCALLAGCGQLDEPAVPTETSTATEFGIALPQSLRALALPPGSYTATVSADCTGTTATLTDDDGDGTYTGTLQVPADQTCIFDIVWTFDDPDFGTVELVTGSVSVAITANPGPINFTENDYLRSDSDGDGIDNLTELDETNRTNPSTSPVWGTMNWGQEKWTARM